MIDALLAQWLADPARARALAAMLNAPATQHLDDEATAATLEGTAPASVLAHLVRCPACARRVDFIAALQLDQPPTHDTRIAHVVPLLVASVQLADGQPPDVSSTSGFVRVMPSLTTRAGDASPSLTLRDASERPSFEVGLVCPPANLRFDLHVNWLQGGAPPHELLVTRAGRVLSRSPFRAQHASVDGLRAGPVHLTLQRSGTIVARAWLHCERS